MGTMSDTTEVRVFSDVQSHALRKASEFNDRLGTGCYVDVVPVLIPNRCVNVRADLLPVLHGEGVLPVVDQLQERTV